MIIVMRPDATTKEIDGVVQRVRKSGIPVNIVRGDERTIIGAVGDLRQLMPESIEVLPGVERVMRILHPFKLSSRDFKKESSTVPVNGVAVGGEAVVVMAGPCAVEGEQQLMAAARAVRRAGATVLRGGAFKPRTSPYSFQGLGREGLEILAKARAETGLPVVTEVLTPGDVELVSEYADILQVGARNMQNYTLLQEVGRGTRPVLLKRGMMASIEELLMSAEYILSSGNHKVMLCERGIRTFEPYTRNTLDLSAIPLLKKLSHLPVVVDPSHGTGRWDLVGAMARAAVAAGADGLLIEVHPSPDNAMSDGPQSLKPEAFSKLMKELGLVAGAVGRSVLKPPLRARSGTGG